MGAKRKPVVYEKITRGYVRIKVAEPNVWRQKQVYIYEQFHKVKVDKYNQVVIFLDGNNRNFNIDNLYLMYRQYCARLNCVRQKDDTKEVVLQKIKLLEVENHMLDVAKKIGMATICYGGVNRKPYRRLKSKANELQRKYNSRLSDEQRKIKNHKIYVSYLKKMDYLKEHDVEKYNELLEKKRSYARKYARKIRNEKQNSRCK